jgi:hypothetical protein
MLLYFMNNCEGVSIMNRSKLVLRGIPSLLGILALAGCTTSASVLTVQSRFAYPNGDYASLGQAVAERSYVRVLFAPVMDREIFVELEQQALATRPGADLMVDYMVASDVFAMPAVFLPLVTYTTFRLEGTAIRFRELGRQELGAGALPAPTRAR